jgi:hypothetical protein
VLNGSVKLGAIEPATSPARELQESVARAFGALEAPGDAPRKERLEGALRELSDIKSRIDALRARRVA